MSTLTQGDLQIECAVPITDIQSFHMEVRQNDHAVCRMEGIIPEAEGEEAILQPLAGTPVRCGYYIFQNLIAAAVSCML